MQLKDSSNSVVQEWKYNVSLPNGWRKIGDSLKFDDLDSNQNYKLKVSLKSEATKATWYDTLTIKKGQKGSAIIQENHYYPFGNLIAGLSWQKIDEDSNQYMYNGKQWNNRFSMNLYDYGARLYDPQVGRWVTADPLSDQYRAFSNYSYTLNNPINAVDPDGKLVIFVNGFRTGAYLDYWSNPFDYRPPWDDAPLYTRDQFSYNNYWKGFNWSEGNDNFLNRFNDYNDIYVDGMFFPLSTAQDRYDRGVADALAIIKKIISGEIEYIAGETIKLVGHSHGGWHAAGMADVFAKAGYTVEGLYMLTPHQPNQKVNRLEGVPDYFSAQYSRMSDCVSSNQECLETLIITFVVSGIPGVVEIPYGDWLVGDSEYAEITWVTEFYQLKDLPNAGHGGHYVEDTAPEVLEIPAKNKGFVRQPNNDNKN